MQTYEEQKAWFDGQRDALLEAVAAGRFAAWIAGFEPLEQRVLCLFARQALKDEAWDQRSLEHLIAVARAGVEVCIAQSEQETEAELRRRRVDVANVISYNLAADLADCWDEDGFERSDEHFEAGLEAARECVRWRAELDKPAGPRSMAWWAKGMHELSLGRHGEARASFERSLDYAREAAEGDGQAFGVVLGEGYLGIAEERAGVEGGRTRYERAVQAFESQSDDAERKDDARFGLHQLRTVELRYA